MSRPVPNECVCLVILSLVLVASCGGGAGADPQAVPEPSIPVATVQSHPGNAVVKTSPVTIGGSVTGGAESVTVSGIAASVANGTFSASVPLREGHNSIDVVAKSSAGQSTTSLDLVLNTTEMCGTGETFTVRLPGLTLPGDPSTSVLSDRRLPNDAVTLPKGCAIYAILVHGYGRNESLDELMFYKLAEFVAESDGYVHWSWWNNFLGEYMSRPLHAAPGSGFDPGPGNVIKNLGKFTIPEGSGKAVPDEDVQFQADAQAVLVAIREENPDAIIVVAGHSMGGNAVARLGSQTGVEIDLLAPIDPVGNRNLPDGIGSALNTSNKTYNWTRWRATHVFRGYKQRDCVRNANGNCRLFQDGLLFEFRCTLVPTNGWLKEPPFPFSKKPLICPRGLAAGPVHDQGTRIAFHGNIKRLYHRWQKEATFPYDFEEDYTFAHPARLSDTDILSANYQRPVAQNSGFERDRNETCSNLLVLDPRGAESFGGIPLLCHGWDGHGEIIGMRAVGPLPVPSNGNLQPLALTASDWEEVNDAADRRDALIAMANDGPWAHRPENPDLDLVVDDLVLIVQDIMAGGEPGPDITPPESSANPDIEPNAFGWHNTDVIVTLSAIDNEGGSGIRDIQFTLSGAESGSGMHEGSTVDVALTAEGTTTITFHATDNAENVEQPNTLVIRIDKTPPTISATVDPEQNPNGWHNSDVTVTFSADDALSGLDSVSDPVIVSEEGAAREIIGVATDRAGNSSASGIVLNIDKTPPEIIGLPEDCSLWPPNHKLVEVADVIATDAISGIATTSVDATSSEPESGPGYGNKVPDTVVTGGAIELRAERYSPAGRTYDLTVVAVDVAGNTAAGQAACVVLHDQGQN